MTDWTHEDETTAEAASQNERVVMPDVYSISVDNPTEAQKVIDAELIDFGQQGFVVADYFYPTDLYIENGVFVCFDDAAKAYTAEEWLAEIGA